jgi:uncharacterized protein with PQ loop repeat
MDYSLVAGFLVTLSLLLLCIERSLSSDTQRIPRIFLLAYGGGVVCWLILGVVINNSALVLISSLQAFFILLFSALPLRST